MVLGSLLSFGPIEEWSRMVVLLKPGASNVVFGSRSLLQMVIVLLCTRWLFVAVTTIGLIIMGILVLVSILRIVWMTVGEHSTFAPMVCMGKRLRPTCIRLVISVGLILRTLCIALGVLDMM